MRGQTKFGSVGPPGGQGAGFPAGKQGRRVWPTSESANHHSRIDCHLDCWAARSRCLKTAVKCRRLEFPEAG